MPRLKAFVFILATLSASSYGQNANPAGPGTLNYIEGQAALNGQQLSSQSVGNTTLAQGQSISTSNGKAEILLTPGVFLRVGSNSTVEMISPALTKTEVRLVQGRADIEIDQLYKQNLFLVDVPNGQAHLVKQGLYGFDAGNSSVRVFDGEADVYPGSNLNTNIEPIKVKGGRQIALNDGTAKPQHFDKDHAADDLYNWSSLRSQYLGQANLGLAQAYAGNTGFYPGWYWAGAPFGYTWLPGDGLFWNPFGYGFYSPYYIGGGGFIYGRYGRGFYPGGYGGFRGSYGGAYMRGGAASGGFRGGMGGGGGRR
ncbi:FecR domain-containing protein [Edaphobacter modestus]|uniref:FecR family protein n=1 Tax=Edaphobacter modestus TaxID=388466 RepID=A0A4Q7YP67_9BACT|nr:FecR domain-containing protein [Edaphobacter modestus]RZU39447.1 FecR family protein [Edaphobacter modestus]